LAHLRKRGQLKVTGIIGALASGNGSGARVNVVNRTYSGSTTSSSITCSTSFSSAGLNTGSGQSSYSWLLSGTASQYEIRMTTTSGTFSSGTTGSWLSLGTTRTWTRQRTSVGISTVTATVEIRDATSLVVLDTATITITAEVIA
jgi:hypothetical protein